MAADNQPNNEEGPLQLPTVLNEELELIKSFKKDAKNKEERRETTGQEIKPPDQNDLTGAFNALHQESLAALCFSGGGIRSATFGLGVVQALAHYGLLDKFDYLSTVSGGGYLGSWLSAWIFREKSEFIEDKVITDKNRLAEYENFKAGKLPKLEREEVDKCDDEIVGFLAANGNFADQGISKVQDKLKTPSIQDDTSPNPEPKQLQYLRKYSNYITPKVGLLSADTWTFFGTYFRNLFLNWTIFIPIIAAILLIPRMLLTVTLLDQVDNSVALTTFAVGLILASFSVAFVINKLPSKNPLIADIKHNTDSWVVCLGVAPIVVLGIVLTTLFGWSGRTDATLGKDLRFWSYLKDDIWYFVIFALAIYVGGYILYFAWRLVTRRNLGKSRLGIVSTLVSGAIGGIILWATGSKMSDLAIFPLAEGWNGLLYLTFALPAFLLIFLTASMLFVGFSSKTASDGDREWLARFGAWMLIVCVGWIVLNGVVLFGPIGFECLVKEFRKPSEFWTDYLIPRAISVVGVISGILSLGGGFTGKSAVKEEPTKSKLSMFLAIVPAIAAPVFFGFIFVFLAYLTSQVLPFIRNFLPGEHLAVLHESTIGFLIAVFFVLFAVGVGMAFVVNVNKFSLHGAYRDRLVRAYLGASNTNRRGNAFTDFDDSDNFQLHRLRLQRPLHVINATLNLIGGSNLAWQNRKAASFTMSPLHSGSWALGYRHSNKYSRNESTGNCKHLRFCNRFDGVCGSVEQCQLPGESVRIGTAMAISGAAANPNMGYYSSPVVTFLMSLFNIRLGWWLGNTGELGSKTDIFGKQFYTKPSPSVAILPLLNETLGRTNESRRYINVSDGGHFENLGLYEMVLRRCKYIVLSDGAADPDFTFGEISNAIRKCKVDLGVTIEFEHGFDIYSRKSAKDDADEKKRFAVADITYPEKYSNGRHHRGFLIYVRPTIYETEPLDVLNYANSNDAFPNQSTGDQFFDEKQFEAYRGLGFYTIENMIGDKTPKDLEILVNMLKHTPAPTGKS